MKLVCLLNLFLLSSVPLLSQGNFPFSIRIQQPDVIASVSNGAVLTFNVPQGRSESLVVNLTYLGSGSVNFASRPDLLGSTAFELIDVPAAPIQLSNGQNYRFGVRYTPRSSALVSSQITLPYTETLTAANGATSTATGQLLLQFNGTSPEFVVSYLTPELVNVTPLAPGAPISFPPAPVNGTATYVISIVNRGTGAGELRSITLAGEEFSIAGLPLLPLNLPAASEIRFNLRFQPNSAGTKIAQLTVTTANGSSTFSIDGLGFEPRFAYELISAEEVRTINPGETISFGEALPGETATLQILIRNVNPISTTLPTISVFGTGFALSENPGTRTLRPGESVGFFIQALVGQIGSQRGRLRIGDDAFDLLLLGSGAQLRYSYSSSGSGSINLPANGSIFFPASVIGSPKTSIVTVRNSGIAEANIINISLSDVNTAFALTDLPTLPARLAPGGELSFGIRFSPTAAGTTSVTLRVDGTTFTLAGSASALPALPRYRFTLSSGPVPALTQPAIGIELLEPYPVAVNGVLSLLQEASGFVNDPSVRFANGSQSINFSIAANSRQAIFANGSSFIRFQTGSVAGDLILSATFGAGGAILPDANQEIVRMTVAPGAPRILSFFVNQAANALGLQLTGLTTSRSVTKLDIELTPLDGFTLAQTKFSIDLEGESFVWFRSSQSQSFGGIFTLQIPLFFSQSGNDSSAQVSNLIQSIASVQVTLTNESGSSSAASVSLR